MSMLDRILSHADRHAARAAVRTDEFIETSRVAPPVRSLSAALSAPGLSVIAEIKRRSPSAGDIDMTIDPVERAVAYVKGGAAAISVLTEPDFFAGSLDDLTAVRSAVDVPVLRKDFTRNAAQIWEARAAGADAVLLIVASLDPTVLGDLIAVADDVGVEAIVEAHTVAEVDVAVAAGASIVGVNNRDLHTFATDLSVAEAASDRLPDTVVRVAESGVSDIVGAKRMAQAGYDAVLVGEALVRSHDPAGLVAALTRT
ncbi:MAG: indole-3-glycerol phosphate synthase TrpC [Acidimicrobiia bacterium]|nr:indole-3-glycerol phosphate synthase TrpC [Acidimicrobiia bacterium]